jgi:hypothetical protein
VVDKFIFGDDDVEYSNDKLDDDRPDDSNRPLRGCFSSTKDFLGSKAAATIIINQS